MEKEEIKKAIVKKRLSKPINLWIVCAVIIILTPIFAIWLDLWFVLKVALTAFMVGILCMVWIGWIKKIANDGYESKPEKVF